MDFLEQSFTVQFNYRLFFTSGLFDPANHTFRKYLEGRAVSGNSQKILFVIDGGVANAHPNLERQIRRYFDSIENLSLTDQFVIVPGGELAKNDQQFLYDIIDAIDANAIDRQSYVAAIGGGSVLDLTGYAAGIAHRGIRHIRIPTTVLSQNDSGVGVKNGINYKGKKNFLGTFVPPTAVFNDDVFLTTLDERNWRSGISEAVKVALIRDGAFFSWLEENAAKLTERNPESMNYLIKRCARLHIEHIASGDPFELGSSRPLDFGHWSAHKLEQLTGFTVLHGEAVALGIALDTVYSAFSGRLSFDKARRIVQLLRNLGFAITHQLLQFETADPAIIGGLQEFREHLGGRLTIMLLKDIGTGEEVHEMDVALLKKSAAYLRDFDKVESISE